MRSALAALVLLALVAVQPASSKRKREENQEGSSKSKRAARKAHKARAAASFHGDASYQLGAASYMPAGWDGTRAAEEIAIPDMFDRIVDGWPGAKYVSQAGPEGPGVIKIENFITEEEADHLVKIGGEAGLDQSSGTGAKQADGTFKREHSDYRTSKNSWLMGVFQEDATVIEVDSRIANLTSLFSGNSEHYQVLRYSGAGDEYYKVHSDFIPGHLELPSGPRLFTMFIYLTDVPEGNGGCTFFPRQAPLKPSLDGHRKPVELGKACKTTYIPWDDIRDADDFECGLMVRPQKGHAVLWPNAKLSNLAQQHPLTEHMALPIHGCDDCVKWAANVWIHLYDFKAAHLLGKGG